MSKEFIIRMILKLVSEAIEMFTASDPKATKSCEAALAHLHVAETAVQIDVPENPSALRPSEQMEKHLKLAEDKRTTKKKD